MPQQNEIQKIVEEVRLIPIVVLEKLFKGHPNFTSLPSQLLNSVMLEMKRLWSPCDRTIDFRYKIKGLTVEKIDRQGITHFLDSFSIDFLDREIKSYKGVYTLGAHEAVKHFFLENKIGLLTEQKIRETDIELVRFGLAVQRAEERMNLAISASLFSIANIEIFPEFVPDESTLGTLVPVVTSNISLTGLKVRCIEALTKGELVVIRFDDLEKELVFNQSLITYSVLKSVYNSKYKMFDCMLKLQEVNTNAEFKAYTKNLIYSYKHKYKVDLDSILEATISKGYEQYCVDRTHSISVFLNEKEKITHIFSNPKSQSLVQSFEIGSNNYLQALMDKNRIVDYLKRDGSCYFFVTRIKIKNNAQVAFLSTILDSSPESMGLAKKFSDGETAKLFKFSMQDVEQAQASKRSTIPEDVQDSYGSHRVHRFSKQALDLVAQDKHIITIVPILDGMLHKMFSANIVYKGASNHILNTSQLSAKKVDLVLAESDDNRVEDRFTFSSPVTVHYQNLEYKGTIVNISSLGLNCRLNQPLNTEPDALVHICFDAFEARTTLYSLNKCNYRVVSSDGRTLRLSNQSITNHDGRAFLQRLILSRLGDLVMLGRENEIYGLNRLLRNLSTVNSPSYHLLTHLYKNKVALSAVSVPIIGLAEISSDEECSLFKTNIKAWFYEPEIITMLNEKLFLDKTQECDKTALLVLSYKMIECKNRVFKASVLTGDDVNNSTLANMLQSDNANGYIARTFELNIGKTGREFKRYYLDELSYIKRFAPHKYKSLRMKISGVKGLIQISEITDLLNHLIPQETSN
jgi:hypothetical protein